ncbi:YozQ family protein [Bacillus sp. FJAT-49736]|uniref:YozQ family protein n=1 Tax=Bacillus sp. FJAT-49736 TaxID=2833582 RepID=UPI001BCA0602|nr:YozQ family protein [Bacillus sp. FJAT-49736]MBS4172153.1 YozQ family protein [Bacillus sp. FJAT-49736]
MSDNKQDYQNLDGGKIADKTYDPSDYKGNSELSKGLATTHEQVSDVYVEGTVDGVMEDVAGDDIPLKR